MNVVVHLCGNHLLGAGLGLTTSTSVPLASMTTEEGT
eukprot:CAMPEP_0118845026 /NCGR_PEP_ID=MMETSP1162-20130426/87839_1 /TAXON_ID=33656 /ORGANISM="Phaeocystis Sp, Strain CCMP2710" /LENGTH=36 /DNA_ID= /DNA_START= /DNA_END= /DNA_ORIENTATION=